MEAGAAAVVDSVAEGHPVAGDIKLDNQKQYPRWILNFLNENEIHEVSHYVTEQEHRTSGEIVTVIARRSSNIGHVTRTLFLLFLLLAVLLNVRELISYEVNYLLGDLGYSAKVYSTIGSLSFIALICGLYGIAEYLENFKCIQRIFVNMQDQKSQVLNRAMLEFYLNHVSHTEKKTGILIFVSLMERQTVVLADNAISTKLDSKVWEEIVSTITSSVKKKKTSEGLKSAIHKCGDILAMHFPAHTSNKNELSNHLIIKE